MRIAIVADIHGNFTALEAVLLDLRQTSPDLILHGGDLLAVHGHRSAEMIDRIRELGWPGVVGNVDEMLWRPERLDFLSERLPNLWRTLLDSISPTLDQLGPERLQWMQQLPAELRRDDLVLQHASPGNLWVAPPADATNEELERVYGSVGGKVVVYGHIHKPYVRRVGGMTVCNTGSVGMSFDGDTRASYLLIDEGVPSTRRVEYDVEAEIRAVQASGYPQAAWFAETLRRATFVLPEN